MGAKFNSMLASITAGVLALVFSTIVVGSAAGPFA